ncbi:unnamed protein product, partial [Ectocarpus sp. 8 AP-2014]
RTRILGTKVVDLPNQAASTRYCHRNDKFHCRSTIITSNDVETGRKTTNRIDSWLSSATAGEIGAASCSSEPPESSTESRAITSAWHPRGCKRITTT